MSDSIALRDPESATLLRRRAMADRLQQQATQQDYRHPLSIGATIAQSLAGALMGYQADSDLRERGEGQRTEASQFMARLLGGGGGGGMAEPAAAQVPVTGPMPASPPGGSYVDRMVQMESGGRADARNPRSSATGAGQFIDSTWLQFAGANPDRFQGMDRAQILAARNNPDLSRQAVDWYRRENLGALSGQGLPANDGTAALAHRFGPQGAAALLRADPNAPIDGVVGAQVMAANPDLAGRTAGQVSGQYAQRFGGGGSPSPQQPPAAPQQPAVDYRMAALEAMQSNNPRIREMAPMLAQMASQRQRENRLQTVAPGGALVDQNGRVVFQAQERAPQASEAERAQARYIALAQNPNRTAAENIELEAVARRVFGSDSVQVGPNGIAFLPAQRPGMGQGGAAAPNAAPAIAAQDGFGGPAPSLAQSANDAVAGAAASPTQRPPQTVNLPNGRTAQYIPAEQPQAQPPQTMATAMLENANGLNQARLALQRATERPQSFGFWRGVQNSIPGINAIDRLDPDGVEARALAANLGSMRIHDRSGAAVTAAEFPRLRPFIPSVGDPPEVVQRKLAEFVREYEAVLRDMNQAFGPSSGYRELPPVSQALGGGGQQQPAQAAPRVITFDAQGRRMQ